jgi:hypothetical protein
LGTVNRFFDLRDHRIFGRTFPYVSSFNPDPNLDGADSEGDYTINFCIDDYSLGACGSEG